MDQSLARRKPAEAALSLRESHRRWVAGMLKEMADEFAMTRRQPTVPCGAAGIVRAGETLLMRAGSAASCPWRRPGQKSADRATLDWQTQRAISSG